MEEFNSLAEPTKRGFDLKKKKSILVNAVCASMIAEPRFDKSDDSGATLILKLVEELAQYDPEFILKLALYVRQDLNIRSTSNFLVAMAANTTPCTPFLKKYFKYIVRLPSDWLDCAALYQILPNRKLKGRALPTCLRKAMAFKFPDFDTYQLGKYNKAGKIKRKKKKEKLLAAQGKAVPTGGKSDLTMKQMIRQLHISQPVNNVMALLGKKYPATQSEFYASGLRGTYDPKRAGKRMKLPVPETWETMLSAKGNKAETWEELMDHRKLPFMAMLRNIRNLILTGVDYKYHRQVWGKLNSEYAISRSRQFPFRFFSAYQALDIDIEKLRTDIKDAKERLKAARSATAAEREKKKAAAKDGKFERVKRVIIPKNMPDEALLRKYREALDNAVKFATIHNVKPIRGNTVVFCLTSSDMRVSARGTRGMGSARTLQDMGVLLGLMCKYMCEQCDFRIFAANGGSSGKSHLSVDLKEGTILDNMAGVSELAESGKLGDGFQFPFDYLEELIRDKIQIDNFIIMSNRMVSPEEDNLDSEHPGGLRGILQKYRQQVNPDLLYVSVNLAGYSGIDRKDGEEESSGKQAHPNDVMISGFSDAILKYIAERGDNNQLHYIDHIDESKGIKGPQSKKQLAARRGGSLFSFSSGFSSRSSYSSFRSSSRSRPKYNFSSSGSTSFSLGWGDEEEKVEEKVEDVDLEQVKKEEQDRLYEVMDSLEEDDAPRSVRLFVSSTFRDMHGERDYLVRYIFPELRQRCKKRKIDFYDVDLRWGVTEKEAEDGGAVELCLQEVDRCRPFFLGILGQRYGWSPETYQVSDDPKMRWVRHYPEGRSVTELEMVYGALRYDSYTTKALFYERDPSYLQDVPEKMRDTFEDNGQDKLDNLKKMITDKGLNIKPYKCKWGGVKQGKMMTAGLEAFGKAVLEDLWGQICSVFSATPIDRSPLEVAHDYHQAFIDGNAKNFVGRKAELKSLNKFMKDTTKAPLVVTGVPGSGKSALLSYFAKTFAASSSEYFVLPHFIGASPGSTDIRHTVLRICRELKSKLNLDVEIPDDYKELRQAFPKILEEATFGKKVLLIIDGLNQLEERERAHSLDWLPHVTKTKIIVSVWNSHKIYSVLSHRKPEITTVTMSPLAEPHRISMVTTILAQYRKKLDDSPGNNQMRYLIRKTESFKPLYLVVACEELRVFGVYEELTRKIKSLAPSLDRLFEEVLRRMEADHNRQLMKTLLCVLACARKGLRERDLIQILAPKGMEELPYRQWSPLYGALEPYFRSIADGALTFFHGQMVAAITKKYLSARGQETASHTLLAEYFWKTADPAGDGSFTGDAKSISELPYHLVKAKMFDKLELVLCNLNFIRSKCKLGMTFDLVADLANAVASFHEKDTSTTSRSSYGFSSSRFSSSSSLSSSFSRKPLRSSSSAKSEVSNTEQKIKDFHRYISGNAVILEEYYDLVFQQAANQPSDSAPAKAAVEIAGNYKTIPWINWQNKPRTHSACLLTLAGTPTDAAMGVAYSPDGNKIAVASRDQTLKIFDAVTGIELSTLSGHSNWVVAVAYSPDGKNLVSGSWDRTVRVWDAIAGVEEFSFEGHSRRVNAVAFGNIQQLVASGSWDCTVRVWSLRTRKQEICFYGHTKPVNSVSFAPDDKTVVSGSWDCSVRVWDIESKSCLRNLQGHSMSVRSVSFSPAGTQIVSTSVDTLVNLWDARTGELTHTLKGHSEPVNTCSFSGDGKHLVSASDDLTVKVWDALGGRQVGMIPTGKERNANNCAYSPNNRRLAVSYNTCGIGLWDVLLQEEIARIDKAHARPVTCIRFSPDGRRIASSSEDGIIKLWSSKDLTEEMVITQHKNAVNGLDFSPDGTKLLTASNDFGMQIIDLSTGEIINECKGHSNTVIDCAWSPDGKRIASVSRDRTVRLWDPETCKMKKVFQGHTDWVVSVEFSSDSKKLVTGSWDFTLKLWDTKKGKELGTMEGHQGAISRVSFSADGEFIVSSSFDTELKLWSVKDSHLITTMNNHTARVNGCSFANTGSQLVSVSDDGTIRFWDALAGQEITTLQGHSEAVHEVAFAPDKHQVVSASGDGSVKVWDASAEREIKGHSQWIGGLSFFENGEKLASASRDGQVKIWNTSSGRVAENVDCGGSPVNDIAVSPTDDRLMVTAQDDNASRVWTRNDETTKNTATGSHASPVRAIAFSPDGKMVATASWDCKVYLREAKNGRMIRVLKGHTDWVDTVAFSPNGQMLASGGHDNSVIIWNPFNGKQEQSFRGHTNWVNGVAFSADSKTLATASYDRTVRLWDAKSGRQLVKIQNHEGIVNSVAFVGSRYVISGAHDSTLRVFDTTRNHLGEEISKFYCKAPVTAVTVQNAQIAAGDSLGNVYVLALENTKM